jgi:hypothetical protein
MKVILHVLCLVNIFGVFPALVTGAIAILHVIVLPERSYVASKLRAEQ